MANSVQIVIQAIDKASKELNGIKSSMTGLDKTAGTSEKSISGVGKSLTSMLGTVTAVTGGIAAFGLVAKQAFDLGKEGASLLRLEEASGNLAQSLDSDMGKVVDAVSRASLGMVSESDIMAASSRAMMLGVSSDSGQLAKLMEIAASKARAMGISTTQAFNDIVTGIGRGSPLILDNLGIVINATETNKKYAESIGKTAEQLTEAEKTQALLNSVLTEGAKQLEAVGGLADDDAAAFERFAAHAKNASDAMKKEFAPVAADVVGWLDNLAFGHNKETTALLNEVNAIKASGASRQEQLAAIRELDIPTTMYVDSLGRLVEAYATQNGQQTRIIDSNYMVLDSVEALPGVYDILANSQTSANDVMAQNYDHLAELAWGHRDVAAAMQAQADAAAQGAIDNTNLAISLKGATFAQFGSAMIAEITEMQGVTSTKKAEMIADVAEATGLSDKVSTALIENMGTFFTNVEEGNIPLVDTKTMLQEIYNGAKDGNPDIDTLNGLWEKQIEVLPEANNLLDNGVGVMTDLNVQLPPAIEGAKDFHTWWKMIGDMEHQHRFHISVETDGGGGGVSFNRPAGADANYRASGKEEARGGEGTVPSGYGGDSFPIFTTSGENVTVQTPPQKFQTDQRYETIMSMLSSQRPATASEIAMAVRDAFLMIPGR